MLLNKKNIKQTAFWLLGIRGYSRTSSYLQALLTELENFCFTDGNYYYYK